MGAVFTDLTCETDMVSTGGRWTTEKTCHHINVLELKAGFIGLKSFCSLLNGVHIKMELDNTTAIAYLLYFGGSRSLSRMKNRACLTIRQSGCSTSKFFEKW